MSENNTTRTEKKIGDTTYFVHTSFNGDKKHDIFKSVVRLVERGILTPPN